MMGRSNLTSKVTFWNYRLCRREQRIGRSSLHISQPKRKRSNILKAPSGLAMLGFVVVPTVVVRLFFVVDLLPDISFNSLNERDSNRHSICSKSPTLEPLSIDVSARIYEASEVTTSG